MRLVDAIDNMPTIEAKMNEYNCVRVKLRDKTGYEFYALYDKARQLLFFNYITMEFAMEGLGFEFVVEESEEKKE